MDPLTVHCLVKNEERWIWYALNSIRDIAQKIIIFDTGSTDNTVKIIKSIKDKKIVFEQKGPATPQKITELRREQIKLTKTNWFLILDGDEIWPQATKKELLKAIKNATKNDWAIVVKAWNLVGDIYHYHPESIRYHWPFAPKDYMGWANLRVLRSGIPGLDVIGNYPLEYYCDSQKKPIQNYGTDHLLFLKNRYFHATYLQRSASRDLDKGILNRAKKNKFEKGIKFQKDINYPEVFFKKHPNIVANPLTKRTKTYELISTFITPPKEFRRRVFNIYNPNEH